MILQKYENIFREINLDIEKFNALLAEEFRIAPLNATTPNPAPSLPTFAGITKCGHTRTSQEFTFFVLTTKRTQADWVPTSEKLP